MILGLFTGLLIADIARFPVIGFANDVRLDVVFPLFLFALVLGKRIVQVMFSFWILRLRLIGVEAFSNLFFLAWLVCFTTDMVSLLFGTEYGGETYTKCLEGTSFHPGPPSLRALTRSTSSA